MATAVDRIPFEEAISEPLLLKKAWDELSLPQQITLRAFNGLPLSKDRISATSGLNELELWSALQCGAEYDDLGYITKVTPVPYIPREYEQLWAIYGRRAGKTNKLMAFIFAYEACLGGHVAYVGDSQECVIYLIAHRADTAKSNMPGIRAILDSSPLLAKEIDAQNADGIRLKNNVRIVPSPPSLRAQRGVAIPVVGMDEVAFWWSDPEAANPDFEVERAVAYSQAQFPHAKRLGITTPWSKEGLAYKYHRAGTCGRLLHSGESKDEYEDILVCFSPTAALENPRITRKRLQQLRLQDSEAFERESLCRFPDSISGFFSPALLHDAVERGVAERGPVLEGPTLPQYVAAMDPAFRYDSFAFCIVHRDLAKGVMVDVTRRWTPVRGEKLNPKVVLSEIRQLLSAYKLNNIYSDQYQLESLQQIALDMGLTIEGVDFTARSKVKIFGNLNQLVNQRKLVLLDPAKHDPNKAMLDELITLERRIGGGGNVNISAPEGKHDDMCAVLALAAFKAVWLTPEIVSTQPVEEKSAFQRCQDTIRKHRLDASQAQINSNWVNWD